MKVKKIDLVPENVNLALYAGDGANLHVDVTDTSKQPVPLSGAVEAQIRVDRASAEVVESFTVDLAGAADGVALLSLTGDQTNALLNGDGTFSGAYDVQWTPDGGEPITLLQGKVTCVRDVTRA